MKKYIILIFLVTNCTLTLASPIDTTHSVVTTYSKNSPVIISAPGSNTKVTINEKDASQNIAPFAFQKEPVPPRAGERSILIAEARLEPLPHFFILSYGPYKNTLAETALIHLTLVNISSLPILITGANVDFHRAKALISTAGDSGGSLGISHVTSTRILLQPGEGREVLIDRAVHFPGIATILAGFPWLTSAQIFNEDNSIGGIQPRLADLRMLPDFNKILKNLYGKATRIGVTVYKGDYIPIAHAVIPIANGVDYFYKAGREGSSKRESPVRFDHSAFLVQAMIDFRRNGAGQGKAPLELTE